MALLKMPAAELPASRSAKSSFPFHVGFTIEAAQC
jgi:hypothetical protein